MTVLRDLGGTMKKSEQSTEYVGKSPTSTTEYEYKNAPAVVS